MYMKPGECAETHKKGLMSPAHVTRFVKTGDVGRQHFPLEDADKVSLTQLSTGECHAPAGRPGGCAMRHAGASQHGHLRKPTTGKRGVKSECAKAPLEISTGGFPQTATAENPANNTFIEAD